MRDWQVTSYLSTSQAKLLRKITPQQEAISMISIMLTASFNCRNILSFIAWFQRTDPCHEALKPGNKGWRFPRVKYTYSQILELVDL